jgi:hypothetical protein
MFETRNKIVQQQSDVCINKFIFFFTPTLFISVSDTYKTLVQHVSVKWPKKLLFFFASILLRHIYKKSRWVETIMLINERLKRLHFDYVIFNFPIVDGWIKLKCTVVYSLKTFLMKNLLNLDAHVYIFILNLNIL